MLTVASGLHSQACGRDVGANRFDRNQIGTAVLWAIDPERFDLTVVGHPAWTPAVGVANAKTDETVPEKAGFALNSHDRSVAIVDCEVISQSG
jgi:hypothetical protein